MAVVEANFPCSCGSPSFLSLIVANGSPVLWLQKNALLKPSTDASRASAVCVLLADHASLRLRLAVSCSPGLWLGSQGLHRLGNLLLQRLQFFCVKGELRQGVRLLFVLIVLLQLHGRAGSLGPAPQPRLLALNGVALLCRQFGQRHLVQQLLEAASNTGRALAAQPAFFKFSHTLRLASCARRCSSFLSSLTSCFVFFSAGAEAGRSSSPSWEEPGSVLATFLFLSALFLEASFSCRRSFSVILSCVTAQLMLLMPGA